jgi:hypothetical protein
MDEKKIPELLTEAIELMTQAFRKLGAANHDERTRELSVAITELETAMMWLNKDRTMRHLLTPSATHMENT